jgi:sugar phosphate isomerase/epimerase
MNSERRKFFKTAGALTAVSGIVPGAAAAFTLPDPAEKAELKISCQEWITPGNTLAEKLDFLEKHGYSGLEISGKGLAARVNEFKTALSGRKVKISAICAGFDGVLASEKEDVRMKAVASMKEILTASGELGSTGLIIVPAFNGQTTLGNKDARETIIPLLKELGGHAVKVKSRILLEPLNRNEAFFLRLVADAAAICKDADSPGISCMADFWHMTWEETSDLGAIISAGKYLHHVHIASRKNRKMPGEDAGDNYIDGFRGLKLLGYRDYVSLECGSVGDKKVTVPAAAKLIREQWAKA